MTDGTPGTDRDPLAVHPSSPTSLIDPNSQTDHGSSPHGVVPGIVGRPVRPAGGPNGDRDRHRGEEAGGYQAAADRWDPRRRWHAWFPSAARCALPVPVHFVPPV